MSVATELRAPVKSGSEMRAILGNAENMSRISEESKRKKERLKMIEKPKKVVSDKPLAAGVVRDTKNVSSDSWCSSDSSDSGGSSSGNTNNNVANCKRRAKQSGLKSSKVVPDKPRSFSAMASVPIKRCDWITTNSDPIYTSFHDEEWGVPIDDDRKLFELLVLSQALAEFTWPDILNKRDTFRKIFDKFEPSSVAKFNESKLMWLKANGISLLSEQKLRAVVENASQMLKIQQEFGSFSDYCWRFVNQRPIRNGFKHARQVPAKTPKSQLISQDLMRRGFRCVGPTVVYSFMQAAGLTNDHLITCFRYHHCNNNQFHLKRHLTPNSEVTQMPPIVVAKIASS